MKLTLKNFRCYTEKIFNLGEKGITLLSGGSGLGKSSIVIAINFALFGAGTKLIHYGKTSCKVELEFQGMKIVRTKRPNRLVVNDVYEDAAGQDIINEKFGKTFGVTGYIAQNALNSFILMSPMEKLSFLEKFAFQNVDLVSIKKRCKGVLKERHEVLLKSTAQLEFAVETLKDIEKPVEIEFPLSSRLKNKEKAMKNEEIRLKNSGILLKKSSRRLNKIKEELSDVKILNATEKEKQTDTTRIQKSINEVSDELNQIDYKGDKILNEKKKLLEDIISLREIEVIETRIKEDTNRLKDMKDTELTSMKKELQKISSTLWKEYSLNEIRDMIKEYKDITEDLEKLSLLKRQLSNININAEDVESVEKTLIVEKEKHSSLRNRYRQIILQRNIYNCPECDTKLQMKDDSLVTVEDTIEGVGGEDTIEDLSKIEESIKLGEIKVETCEKKFFVVKSKLEKSKSLVKEISDIENAYEDELPSIKSVQEDLQYVQEYRRSQLELEKRKLKTERNIVEEVFSTTLINFEEGIVKLQKRLQKLKTKTKNTEEVNEETLREFVRDQTLAGKKILELQNRKHKLENELKIQNQSIQILHEQHLKKYKKNRKENEIITLISKEKDKISELENEQKKYLSNVEKINNYKLYREKNDKFNTWTNRKLSLTKNEQKNRNKYTAVSLLKEKINEAESIAMTNIVESINTHAQIYLDAFFPDDPISVILKTFKETKHNKKAQINVEVDYKGMEADLNMLSGGELSRVILAFTLALGEMFNTPLIMLDECTASLDQDLTTTVFDALRLGFKDKLVLCICHQVVVGNAFDRIIAVGGV